MALFPPAPPMNIVSGPTSGFFQNQEKAFFAKAGKEYTTEDDKLVRHPPLLCRVPFEGP